MSTVHTSSPWHISGTDTDTGAPAELAGADGAPIANFFRHNPNNEANARLIAAAPELLEALIAMLDVNHTCGVHCDKNKPCPIGEHARAAVTKATGGVQSEPPLCRACGGSGQITVYGQGLLNPETIPCGQCGGQCRWTTKVVAS